MFKKLLIYFMITIFIVGLSGCKNNPETSMDSTDSNVSTASNETTTTKNDGDYKLPDFSGTGNTSSNIINDGIAAEYEGYAYHSDKMMAGSIWRTSISTGESELIVKGTYHSINVNNGYLFMAGYEDDGEELFSGREGMFLMSLEDQEIKLIKEGDYNYMTLYNNWMYYIDDMDGGLYRIRPDGSEDTLLFEGTYDVFAIANDLIYIQTYLLDSDDYDYIYTLPLEGGTPKKMMEDSIWGGNFHMGDDYIYYLTRENSSDYYKVDLYGNNKTSSFDFNTSYINVSENYIYYYLSSGNDEMPEKGVYRMNRDGSNNQLFYAGSDIFSINVAGGYVFWHTNDDQRRLTMMSEEGGEPIYATQALE